jgi:hypothetical protein
VELLSPNNLCASVFPEPEVPGAPVVPNFPLVIACITCDPAYQNLPLDVCEPVLPPVVEPDPPLDAGPQDVVIEDVVIEDVEYEDVVIEDVVIEDVEYEDVVIEDVEYEDVVIEDVEPPPPPPPPPEPLPPSTCKTCHAPNDYNGQYSIEDPHPWVSIDCVGCHGGDGTATNPVFAHVCPPPEIGSRYQQVFDQRAFFLSYTRAGVQLLPNYTCPQQNGQQKQTSPLEWLAFVNPGDLRAGRGSEQTGPLGCAKCHQSINDSVSRSVMGNATGLNSGTRHGIGAPNKYPERRGRTAATDWNTMADYGATAIENPDYDPNNRVLGEVPSLKQPEVFTGAAFRNNNAYTADVVNNSLEVNNVNAENYPNGINNNVAEQLFQEVLNQACTGCHLQSHYNNFRAGDYRSAGCSACHFQTGVLGRSASTDPNLDKYEPVNPNFLTPGEQSHIVDHRIRNVSKFTIRQDGTSFITQGVDNNNCIICHEGSNRTVAQYAGYRLDQNQDLTNNNFYPSANNVTFTYKTELFGENQFFNNRAVTQWIDTEIWQADVATQDETPPDVHHEAGMGCIDCHGTGALHGEGQIYSRMKIQTHQSDTLCETCHGSIDAYAPNNGQNVLDQSGTPLTNIIVNNANRGDFWLVSKLTGRLHYIPQVKDTLNATYAGGGGKVYPPGSHRVGQPIFNWVSAYSKGRYQSAQDLRDGIGPEQPNNAAIQIPEGFSHIDGYYGAQVGEKNKGLECYTCHSAWQNNCIGCHLDAEYDDNQANYFYSQVTGERIYFNVNANFVYQNPINFMLGINDRGKISPYQGLHRFFSYTDLNGDTSNRVSYADRNGLGNDPQLKNANRNQFPALQNQPFTPHTTRNRYTASAIGQRGCLDCHLPNANQVFITDQQNQTYDITNAVANYAASAAVRIPESRGLGSNLWQFDADGNAVVDTNNAPVYDLDRLVEADGTSNSSSNHPLLDPLGANPDYVAFQDLNNARMARPFTQTLLQRLQTLDAYGLTNVYYYNSQPGANPQDTNVVFYFLNDYNYAQ